MALSLQEKELICALDLAGADGKQSQLELADELAQTFEHGSNETPQDLWKARKYRKKFQLSPLGEHKKTLRRTKTAYQINSLFQLCRLTLLKLNTLATELGKPFLMRFFGIAGFSYALSFLFDLGVVLHNTFFPKIENERQLTKLQRFKVSMQKDGRPARMINSGMWFIINFTTFWLNPALSFALNLVGFGLDLIIDLRRKVNHIRDENKLLEKIHQEQQHLNPNEPLIPLENSNSLNDIYSQVKNKKNDDIKNHLVDFGLAIFVAAGIVLSMIPPVSWLGAIITGFGLAFEMSNRVNAVVAKKTKQQTLNFAPIPNETNIKPNVPHINNTYAQCFQRLTAPTKLPEVTNDHTIDRTSEEIAALLEEEKINLESKNSDVDPVNQRTILQEQINDNNVASEQITNDQFGKNLLAVNSLFTHDQSATHLNSAELIPEQPTAQIIPVNG